MKINEVIDNDIARFKKEFLAFMASSKSNTWINNKSMEVYVRKAHHSFNDTLIRTLDIANINIKNPGQGTGMHIINWMHSVNPFPITFIESIQNKKFYEHLIREGWIEKPNSIPPCVYKEK